MSRMSLANVTKGRIKSPAKVMVYGPDGVGKSSFGAAAPKPVFLGPEVGTEELDVSRMPHPTQWPEALEGLSVLFLENHDYQSVVIDTVDWLEPMLYEFILTKVTKMTDDFSAGYALAREQWRLFMAGLEKLRAEKHMNVIVLAHAEIKEFKNPTGPDYDQWRIALQEKSAGLFRQWASDVLFATFETFAAKTKGDTKAKGVSTGKRIAYTEFRAGWYAKNRHGMPSEIPFSWDTFAEYLNRDVEKDSAALREWITKTAEQILDKAVREKVQTFLTRKNVSIDELRSALSRAETLVYEQTVTKE